MKWWQTASRWAEHQQRQGLLLKKNSFNKNIIDRKWGKFVHTFHDPPRKQTRYKISCNYFNWSNFNVFSNRQQLYLSARCLHINLITYMTECVTGWNVTLPSVTWHWKHDWGKAWIFSRSLDHYLLKKNLQSIIRNKASWRWRKPGLQAGDLRISWI